MISDTVSKAIAEVPPDLDLLNLEWDPENTVSQSSLNMFIRCPRQWKYKDLKLPTISVPSEAAEFGSSVHAKIADYHKSIGDPRWMTEAGILERLENILFTIEKIPKGKNMRKIVSELLKFELWRKRRYPEESMNPTGSELYFKVPPFHGYIDMLAHDFVLDWKTGNSTVSQDYIREVNVYFYAALGLGHPVKKGFLMFLETGMKPMVPINLPKVLKEAYVFFKLTSDPSFSYPPNRTWLCRWCSWRNICEQENKFAHEFVISVILRKRFERLRGVGMLE